MTELRSLTGAIPRKINVRLKNRPLPPEMSLVREEITGRVDQFTDREDRIRAILTSILNYSENARLDKVLNLCVDLVQDEIESEVKYVEETLKWYHQSRVEIYGVQYNRGKYYVEYGYMEDGSWKSNWQEVPGVFEKVEEECC